MRWLICETEHKLLADKRNIISADMRNGTLGKKHICLFWPDPHRINVGTVYPTPIKKKIYYDSDNGNSSLANFLA